MAADFLQSNLFNPTVPSERALKETRRRVIRQAKGQSRNGMHHAPLSADSSRYMSRNNNSNVESSSYKGHETVEKLQRSKALQLPKTSEEQTGLDEIQRNLRRFDLANDNIDHSSLTQVISATMGSDYARETLHNPFDGIPKQETEGNATEMHQTNQTGMEGSEKPIDHESAFTERQRFLHILHLLFRLKFANSHNTKDDKIVLVDNEDTEYQSNNTGQCKMSKKKKEKRKVYRPNLWKRLLQEHTAKQQTEETSTATKKRHRLRKKNPYRPCLVIQDPDKDFVFICNLTSVGNWFSSAQISSWKHMDWENATGCLNLTVAEWNPFTIFKKSTPPYIVVGSAMDIIDIIADQLGFCYTLVRGKDTDWGMKLPDGTWSGSIGILHRGEASMSATVYSQSYARTKVVDFGEPIYIDEQTVAYKRPTLQPDITGFVKPYQFEVWIGILLTIFLVYAVLVSVQFVHNILVATSSLPIREKKKITDDIGFTHCQWSFCGLIDQSMHWEPSGIPVRIIGAIWMLMALILSIYYRSNLRAILITPKISLPFEDFWDLSETHIQVWTPLGSRFNEALDNAEDGSKLASIRGNVHLTRNATEGRAEFYNGKWGIISVRKTLIYYMHYHFSRNSFCKFYIIKDGVLRTTPLSFGYPKGSTLREAVDPIVRNLREFGIIDYLFEQRVRNASECLKPVGKGFADKHRALGFGDFYGVFAIYMGGILLSCLSFFSEQAASPINKADEKKKSAGENRKLK